MGQATPEEIAWAAGLFEGEGTLYLHSMNSTQKYLALGLNMTDEDVVRKFARIVEKGNVFLYHPPSHQDRKIQWRWSLSGKAAIDVMWILSPHLGDRRRTRLTELLFEIKAVSYHEPA